MTAAPSNDSSKNESSVKKSDGAESSVAKDQQPGKVGQLIEKLQRSRVMRANTHMSDHGGNVLSAGMSFQALFAVFAALWVGFSVFGIFLRNRPELLKILVEQIDTLVPGLLGADGAVDVNTLLGGSALSWTSIIAGASLLLLVITWFTSTRTAIRLLFGLETIAYKNPLLLKLRDFALAAVFGVLIVLSAGITVVGSSVMTGVLQWFGLSSENWLFGWAGVLLRYGLMFLSYWFVLWAIHRYLAEVPAPNTRLWVGSIPGAFALLVLTILGTSVLGGASKNPLLASFVVIIALLLWFNFICRILLFTSSWIVCGTDTTLGLPPKLADKDQAELDRIRAITRAGIDASQADGIDVSLLEPYARIQDTYTSKKKRR